MYSILYIITCDTLINHYLLTYLLTVSIEGQGHFFTIYFPGFVCFVLYWAKISGELLQDHWSSGLFRSDKNSGCYGNL